MSSCEHVRPALFGAARTAPPTVLPMVLTPFRGAHHGERKFARICIEGARFALKAARASATTGFPGLKRPRLPSTLTSIAVDTSSLPALSEPGSHPRWPKHSPATRTSASRCRPTRTSSCTIRRRRSGRCRGRRGRVYGQPRGMTAVNWNCFGSVLRATTGKQQFRTGRSRTAERMSVRVPRRHPASVLIRIRRRLRL